MLRKLSHLEAKCGCSTSEKSTNFIQFGLPTWFDILHSFNMYLLTLLPLLHIGKASDEGKRRTRPCEICHVICSNSAGSCSEDKCRIAMLLDPPLLAGKTPTGTHAIGVSSSLAGSVLRKDEIHSRYRSRIRPQTEQPLRTH